MGAKYAPTVANIFMSKWEDIFRHPKKELKMFKRYINDIFILWEGTEETLKEFLNSINVNKYDITFSGSYNSKLVNFLDLEIFYRG